MVRIRLSRHGRKNAPSYRIIVVDSHKKRDGKYLEKLGYYNPSEDDKKVVFEKDRYKYWLSVGAQPSEAVKKLVAGKYKFQKYDPKAQENEKTEEVTDETESKDKTEPKTEEKKEDKEVS